MWEGAFGSLKTMSFRAQRGIPVWRINISARYTASQLGLRRRLQAQTSLESGISHSFYYE